MCEHSVVRAICEKALTLWESERCRNPFKGNPGKKRVQRRLQDRARKVSVEQCIFDHLGEPVNEAIACIVAEDVEGEGVEYAQAEEPDVAVDDDAELAVQALLSSVPAYPGEAGWEVKSKPSELRIKKGQVLAQKFPNGWHRGRVKGKASGARDKGKWNVFFSVDYEVYACPLSLDEYGVNGQWVYLQKSKQK